jgi:tetratricopeptide (TPR) repeat protein
MRSNGVAAIVLGFLLAATGCHKARPAPTVSLPPIPPPPPPVTVTIDVPLPAEPELTAPAPPAVAMLDDANRAFAEGHYDQAERLYDGFLRTNPTLRRDEALFYAGLSQALKPAGSADWKRATTFFRQLIQEHPNSAYKPTAHLLLTLRTDLDQATADVRQSNQRLKQLTTELDRLRKIDADRRRR